MKRFVAIMLIVVFAMALCIGASAAASQQKSRDGKVTYKTEPVSAELAALIKGGYSFMVGNNQCYSYNGVNYILVGNDIYEGIGLSIYDADTKTSAKGGTSLKTGTALVAVLALTACFAGGAAVITGKKA